MLQIKENPRKKNKKVKLDKKLLTNEQRIAIVEQLMFDNFGLM